MAEKGMQQDAPAAAVATEMRAMDLAGTPPGAGAMATKERDAALDLDVSGDAEGEQERGSGRAGGAPSGSITHPDGSTLWRDEDGTWTYHSAKGTLYKWDDSAAGWRDFVTRQLSPGLPVPEELGRRLTMGESPEVI